MGGEVSGVWVGDGQAGGHTGHREGSYGVKRQ